MSVDVVAVSAEDVERVRERMRWGVGGRRDPRVCVCGHGAGAHFDLSGAGVPVDALPVGAVGCQSGKVPCDCNQFKWVLTMSDIRSFIQKTEGPGPMHALSKGLVSSAARGLVPEWREGICCFWCKRGVAEVGTLIPIAYNERGGEAMRATADNRLHCVGCRAAILAGDYSGRAHEQEQETGSESGGADTEAEQAPVV